MIPRWQLWAALRAAHRRQHDHDEPRPTRRPVVTLAEHLVASEPPHTDGTGEDHWSGFQPDEIARGAAAQTDTAMQAARASWQRSQVTVEMLRSELEHQRKEL